MSQVAQQVVPNTVAPVAPVATAIAQAFSKQQGRMRIGTAGVVAGKLMPIQKVEALLGVKSARMADAAALRAAMEQVDAKCAIGLVSAGEQRLTALFGLFAANTPEARKGALSLDAFKDDADKAQNPLYQRASERRTISDCYDHCGPAKLLAACKGKTWQGIMSACRAERDAAKTALAERELRASMYAQYMTDDGDVTDEVKAKVDAGVKAAHDKATMEALAAEEEAQTPAGIAKRIAKSLVNATDEVQALEVCALLRDAVKTYAAEVRAKAEKLAKAKAKAGK